jgi:Berberine and berberine like
MLCGRAMPIRPAKCCTATNLRGFPRLSCRMVNGSTSTILCLRRRGHWAVELHFNKGVAGAPPAAIAAARNTATSPAVLNAFALAILAGGGPPAYSGVAGREPHVTDARRRAAAIQRAMTELRKLVPDAASYVSESNFFETGWQESFWGQNYPRLLAIKDKYDPDGLFFVHHGVGSERWSQDGFTRIAGHP